MSASASSSTSIPFPGTSRATVRTRSGAGEAPSGRKELGIHAGPDELQRGPPLRRRDHHQAAAEVVAHARHERGGTDLRLQAPLAELGGTVNRHAPAPAAAVRAIPKVGGQQRHVAGHVREMRVHVADAAPPQLVPEAHRLREVEELPDRAARSARGHPERPQERASPGAWMAEQHAQVGARQLASGRQDRVRPGELIAVFRGQHLALGGAPDRERAHVRPEGAERVHLTLDERVRDRRIAAAENAEAHSAQRAPARKAGPSTGSSGARSRRPRASRRSRVRCSSRSTLRAPASGTCGRRRTRPQT